MRFATPNITAQQTGGQTQFVDTNPYTNPGTNNTTLQQILTPGEQGKKVLALLGPTTGAPRVQSQAATALSGNASTHVTQLAATNVIKAPSEWSATARRKRKRSHKADCHRLLITSGLH